jgi:two-component system chemotaxis response regulator CheB
MANMRYDVVTVVASRRGIPQLCEMIAQLPPEFATPIVCLVEGDARLRSEVAEKTRLPVKWVEAGETAQPGHVYLSRPGTSIVMLEGCRFSVSPVGPESYSMRPIDSFLSSTARACGPRCLAIVLAAFHDDGAEGARTLKWRGGTVIVLDRATAEYYGMAEPIVKAGSYDRILTAAEVGSALRASFTGRDLLRNAELQVELGKLLDSALRISGTHMGDMQLLEAVTGRLHIVASRGLGREYVDRFGIVRIDRDDLPCVHALRHKHRVVIENVFEDSHYQHFRDIAQTSGYSALQATPLFTNGDVGGILSTLYTYPHAVTSHESKNLDDIAQSARQLLRELH